uniref:Uncharacterized protein n=1 Tax=Ditylum brightwellii TaxID=49249 RepID=A0A7S2E9Y4_9STRA|mmetsp:Transcript_21207/g.31493  ORF Transcript_21207/g.31493 Transcript_21207/m.31493 type:complete len:265 (+) Transcript_21207:1-795(+)
MESPLWSSRRLVNVQGEEYDPSSPSWSTTFATSVPRRGMAFANVDIFTHISSNFVRSDSNDANDAFGAKHILLSMERELAADIGAMPPGTVLIAVGPVPCLVAQYYLESLPLSGLILVDPVILPPLPGENTVAAAESAKEVLDILFQSNKKDNHPLLHNLSECEVIERTIVEDLAKTCSSWDRPLRLEPGSVPMLILSSSRRETNKSDDSHVKHDTIIQAGAQGTASIHSIYDEEDMQVKRIGIGTGDDDVLGIIFEFIDESVQ